MKLLAVNKFYFLKGGSERYFFMLSSLLEQKGAQVIPFSMKDSHNEPSQYENYFIENIDYSQGSIPGRIRNSVGVIYSLEARRKIRGLIECIKPDIAHLHVFQHQFSPSIIGELKRHGIPVINTVHDLKPLCPNYRMYNRGEPCEKCKVHKYYNCILGRCTKGSLAASLVNTVEMYLHLMLGSYGAIDMYITPSLFFKEKFIEYGFEKERIAHIPNFIDTSAYVPAYGSNDYFIYIGRLCEEKGVFTLLKAMEKVKRSNLLIVGEGPASETIGLEIQRRGLDNIKLIGYKAGRELEDLIKNSRFAVIPSEWYENCPMSVLECMAYGKPVIGSDIGGIPELIENERTGLLFEPRNSDMLAEHINMMLDKPGALGQMGKEARNKAEKEYNCDIHFEKITSIYNKILNKYGRLLWRV